MGKTISKKAYKKGIRKHPHGRGEDALGSGKLKAVLFLLLPLTVCTFGYLLYKKFGSGDEANGHQNTASAVSSAPVAVEKNSDSGVGAVRAAHSRPVQPARSAPVDLFVMPYDAQKLYWVGRSCTTSQTGTIRRQVCDVIFELAMAGKRYQIHADELEAMGYQVFSAPYCYARLTDNQGNKKQFYCKPHEIKEDDNNNFKQPYEINAGLIASNDKADEKSKTNEEQGAL